MPAELTGMGFLRHRNGHTNGAASSSPPVTGELDDVAKRVTSWKTIIGAAAGVVALLVTFGWTAHAVVQDRPTRAEVARQIVEHSARPHDTAAVEMHQLDLRMVGVETRYDAVKERLDEILAILREMKTPPAPAPAKTAPTTAPKGK